MVEGGRRWSKVVEGGRRWSKAVEGGRNLEISVRLRTKRVSRVCDWHE